MKKSLYIFALAVLFANPGFSQSEESHFSGSFAVTAEGGAAVSKTDFKSSKIGFIARGGVEYFFPSNNIGTFGLRLFGGAGNVAGKDGVTGKFPNVKEFKTNFFFGQFGLEYILSLGVVNPYIFGGITYLNFDPKDKNGNDFPKSVGTYETNEIDYNAEAGLRFLVSENFTINLNGAAHLSSEDVLDGFPNSTTNGQYNDIFFTFAAGVSYYFISNKDKDGDGVKYPYDLCESTPPGIAVDEFGCPVDSDNDNVPDYKDKCPGTPVNAKVDTNGCPVDTDKDGVFDYADDCPATPENVNVDKSGCPVDSDKDGMPDHLDKCPDTSPNARVDSFGCEIVKKVKVPEKEFTLSGSTNFEFGKAALTPNARKLLSGFAEKMKENPDGRYRIVGYTDNVGSEAYNKRLSLQRAQSVLNYFVEQGLDRSRFEVYGRGSENPIGDNELEYGRALNRRVTITDINYEKEEKSSSKKILRNGGTYNYSNDKIVEGTIFTDGDLYTIQVSSWESMSKAQSETSKLRQAGHNAVVFRSGLNGEDQYRVRIGYFQSLQDAKAYIKKHFSPEKPKTDDSKENDKNKNGNEEKHINEIY